MNAFKMYSIPIPGKQAQNIDDFSCTKQKFDQILSQMRMPLLPQPTC